MIQEQQNTRHTALVTGASSGIGLEMARLLAARKTEVILVSRRADELEKVAQALRSRYGAAVHVLAADLARADAAEAIHREVRERGLTVDWLINNAGVGIYGEHLDLAVGDLQRMLQLNILTLVELCQRFGNEMRARRSGRILNIASTAGYQPAPYYAAYGASKAFVLNFSEALAKELEDSGVTVSCLSPGTTDTGFFKEVDARGVKNAQIEKRGTAVEVARQGVELMLAGGLSKIVGVGNYLKALSTRLGTRSMVAAASKRILAPVKG